MSYCKCTSQVHLLSSQLEAPSLGHVQSNTVFNNHTAPSVVSGVSLSHSPLQMFFLFSLTDGSQFLEVPGDAAVPLSGDVCDKAERCRKVRRRSGRCRRRWRLKGCLAKAGLFLVVKAGWSMPREIPDFLLHVWQLETGALVSVYVPSRIIYTHSAFQGMFWRRISVFGSVGPVTQEE